MSRCPFSHSRRSVRPISLSLARRTISSSSPCRTTLQPSSARPSRFDSADFAENTRTTTFDPSSRLTFSRAIRTPENLNGMPRCDRNPSDIPMRRTNARESPWPCESAEVSLSQGSCGGITTSRSSMTSMFMPPNVRTPLFRFSSLHVPHLTNSTPNVPCRVTLNPSTNVLLNTLLFRAEARDVKYPVWCAASHAPQLNKPSMRSVPETRIQYRARSPIIVPSNYFFHTRP